MSVKVKPKQEHFVEQAPDAQPQGLRRGRRRQVTLTIPDELLADLDRVAARNGLSRAGALNQAAKRWVEHES